MKIFQVIRRIVSVHGVRSKQILNPNQHGLTNIAFYSQELSKELPRDFLKVHALNLKLENKTCISKIAKKMYEQNKNISIQTIGRSFFVTNKKIITEDIKNNSGYQTEQKLYNALKEYAKISQDSLVIFHSLDLFDYQENKFVEKDFLIVNVSKSYIISIECKKTLDGTKTRFAIDQLKSAKNILEQYFNSNLEIINSLKKEEWCFIPMIYCKNLQAEFSGSSEMHIIKGKLISTRFK